MAIEGDQPRQAECVIFANHKDGTGKTTSCASTAGYLTKNGNKVPVVDFNPNDSATSGLGIDNMSKSSTLRDWQHERPGVHYRHPASN